MNDEKVFPLSKREKDVVGLLLQGKSNKQIALALGLSERTIEFHLNNIYTKMQVGSRVELILLLGKTANPVESTVVLDGEILDNGNQPVSPRGAKLWRDTFSLIRKEVAMTIRISFEELENYLRGRPALLGFLLFSTASLTTRFMLTELGLYHWATYALLGIILAAGSITLGMLWKALNEKFNPLMLLALTVLLPLTAAVFDQIYLNTILRNGGQIATSIANISTQAAWLVSPEGYNYLHTERHATSDALWWLTNLSAALLFLLTSISSKRLNRQDISPT
ncbi:MAG: helix-turn-helix transcriptional regulator [Anaerolineales bacterium]|nr:helix-turn-helix transcriptional regulator [Anaerolineales bacterium]